jgi:hypothetical protein
MRIYHRLLSWFNLALMQCSSNSGLASVRPYVSFSLSLHDSSSHRCLRVAPLLFVSSQKSSRSALGIALRFAQSVRQVSTDELMRIFFSFLFLFSVNLSFVSFLFSSLGFFASTISFPPLFYFFFLCIFRSK